MKFRAGTLVAAMLMAVTALAAETINWTANPSSDAVTGYKLYWATNSAAPIPWLMLTNVTGLSAPGSTIPIAGTSRNFYYVTAVNAGGESDPSDVAFRPGKILNVKVTGPNVTWTADPASDQIVNYRLYWSTNSAAAKPWTVIATVTTTSAPGSTVPITDPARNYYYVVAANPFGDSDPSDVAFKPGAPTGLKAVP